MDVPIIPSSLKKYRCSFKRHQKEFLAPLPGRIFNIYQVLNHKSHLLAIYIICHLPLIFLPPLHKNLPFYSPSFHLPFSCQISCLLSLLVLPCAFYLLASLLAKNLLLWILIHLLIFQKIRL